MDIILCRNNSTCRVAFKMTTNDSHIAVKSCIHNSYKITTITIQLYHAVIGELTLSNSYTDIMSDCNNSTSMISIYFIIGKMTVSYCYGDFI